MRTSVRSLVLAVSLWLAGTVAAHAVELQWWSHWAIEDNKKAVLFEAKRRFEQKNPGHTVTITFYEKKNMFTALRAAFTAGSGFPDVLYYDIDAPEFMQAGWLADLSTGVRWENVEPFGKAFWTRPGPGGKTGTWAIPVEAASDETEVLEISAALLSELSKGHPPVAAALRKFCRQRLLLNVMNGSALFRPFDGNDRRTLIERFRAREVSGSTTIIREGEHSDGLYVILSGETQVSKEGRVIALLREGDIFGEMSLLDKAPATATVSSTRRTSLLRLPRQDFDELIMSHPQILVLVSELTDDRRRQTEAIFSGNPATAEDALILV